MVGIFEVSGQLMDSMLGDDRVQSTLGSRLSGLFSREIRSEPANDSSAAREVHDAWMAHFPEMLASYAIPETMVYSIFMGFGPGQILWDTTGKLWKPYPRPWHPRYTFYEWVTRKYVAISQDGNIPIFPGDGKWYMHTPYGSYRGFVRGAVRAVAEPWIIRHFAIRDWARFSEVHGLPTRVGYTPAVADPAERSLFEQNLATLGSEPTLLVPRGVDKESKDTGYGYELVEATSTAWEAFPGLRDHCDMAIVLALLFQNLTTEVKGGSFAATKAHMDVRQQAIAQDNASWKTTFHRDFARPFSFLNFGDADLAPWVWFDTTPREDYEANAKQFSEFGKAIQLLRHAGIEFTDAEQVRDFARKRFNLAELPDFKFVAPVGPGSGPGGGAGGPPEGGGDETDDADKELPTGGADDGKDGTRK
jgi:phage gp29-like protein